MKTYLNSNFHNSNLFLQHYIWKAIDTLELIFIENTLIGVQSILFDVTLDFK